MDKIPNDIIKEIISLLRPCGQLMLSLTSRRMYQLVDLRMTREDRYVCLMEVGVVDNVPDDVPHILRVKSGNKKYINPNENTYVFVIQFGYLDLFIWLENEHGNLVRKDDGTVTYMAKYGRIDFLEHIDERRYPMSGVLVLWRQKMGI
jgi:hypothetical protein